MLKWMTAGESHGPALVAILSGMPAGLEVSIGRINDELKRRQQGRGRSARQDIEKDEAEILSGIRHGVTMGSPIALLVRNRDHENWREEMSVEAVGEKASGERLLPRPGHADLAGTLKWGLEDPRNVMERASGRTTAVSVALGAVARQFLETFGIHVGSRVLKFGGVAVMDIEEPPPTRQQIGDDPALWLRSFGKFSPAMQQRADRVIQDCSESGDTVGGVIRVVAAQVPPGLGSCCLPEDRLDSRLAAAVIGVPGIKAVAFGSAMVQAEEKGRSAHDEFALADNESCEPWFARLTNKAGGLEGGITNGEPLCIDAWMKPLSTVKPPLMSVDPLTGSSCRPERSERGDVCALESAACVLEAVVALELARALLQKFGGDTMDEIKRAVSRYMDSLRR